MSDVTVSVVENNTLVTVSGDVVDISVTENPVTITTGTSGPQGATGVIAATAPITYNSGTQTVAINQAGLTLAQSQITGLVSDLAGKASLGAANAFTVGGHVITNAATAVVPLVLKGAASQSADLLKIQSSAASDLFTVRNDGQITTVAGINATGLSLNSFGGAAVSGRIVHITTSNATLVPLNVRGAASQSANLQEWQNSAGTVLAKIDSTGIIQSANAFQGTGFLNTSGQTTISIATNRNVGLATASGSYGGGQATVFIGNATTVPSSNPSGGGILYVESGALKYRGTSGSAGTLINADGTITATDATVATAANGVGYMGLPQNSTTTGSYTIVAADAGEHIYASATRTVTIPANASVAFPIGTTLTFIAGAGATMTIAITTDTMYLAGAGTTGSRTLAAHGIATAVKTTSTTWLISGNGLT
jgi:hypothetical protein